MTWLRKILHVTRRDRIKNIDIRETLLYIRRKLWLIKSGEEDLIGSVMCHEWMKEGCHLGQCTVRPILKEEGREEVH